MHSQSAEEVRFHGILFILLDALFLELVWSASVRGWHWWYLPVGGIVTFFFVPTILENGIRWIRGERHCQCLWCSAETAKSGKIKTISQL